MTKEDRKAFGKRVYEYRVSSDLRVRQAASVFRVSVGTLLNIEAGRPVLDRTRVKVEQILSTLTVAA
jgi:hypothetical protein